VPVGLPWPTGSPDHRPTPGPAAALRVSAFLPLWRSRCIAAGRVAWPAQNDLEVGTARPLRSGRRRRCSRPDAGGGQQTPVTARPPQDGSRRVVRCDELRSTASEQVPDVECAARPPTSSSNARHPAGTEPQGHYREALIRSIGRSGRTRRQTLLPFRATAGLSTSTPGHELRVNTSPVQVGPRDQPPPICSSCRIRDPRLRVVRREHYVQSSLLRDGGPGSNP
jgi:hypothetical protein